LSVSETTPSVVTASVVALFAGRVGLEGAVYGSATDPWLPVAYCTSGVWPICPAANSHSSGDAPVEIWSYTNLRAPPALPPPATSAIENVTAGSCFCRIASEEVPPADATATIRSLFVLPRSPEYRTAAASSASVTRPFASTRSIGRKPAGGVVAPLSSR
jgi:hypothetical protein